MKVNLLKYFTFSKPGPAMAKRERPPPLDVRLLACAMDAGALDEALSLFSRDEARALLAERLPPCCGSSRCSDSACELPIECVFSRHAAPAVNDTRVHMIQVFLKHGSQLGRVPILACLLFDPCYVVERLLALPGFDANAIYVLPNKTRTLLEMACYDTGLAMVPLCRLLLRYGADPTKASRHGTVAPIAFVCSHCTAEYVALFLDVYPDLLSYTSPRSLRTLLMYAVQNKTHGPSIIRLLLARGADVAVKLASRNVYEHALGSKTMNLAELPPNKTALRDTKDFCHPKHPDPLRLLQIALEYGYTLHVCKSFLKNLATQPYPILWAFHRYRVAMRLTEVPAFNAVTALVAHRETATIPEIVEKKRHYNMLHIAALTSLARTRVWMKMRCNPLVLYPC
jgi:Ankyrin repeat